MKYILTAFMLLGLTLGAVSCAKVVDDVTAPSEPEETDTLAPRVEPKSFEKKYNPEIEEEIESQEYPMETEEMESKPLFK